jgi:hypothetical protein
VTGAAGLMGLDVAGACRHTMALGGFGRANEVSAIADRGCEVHGGEDVLLGVGGAGWT